MQFVISLADIVKDNLAWSKKVQLVLLLAIIHRHKGGNLGNVLSSHCDH